MSKTSADRAYRYIQSKLTAGELVAGSRLVNRSLAKEVGVSVIPIREAIRRLAGEGLLEYLPGQGAYVPEPSDNDLCEMYDLREALECHAVGKVCGNLSKSDLLRMSECNEEMTALAEVSFIAERPEGTRVWRWKSPREYERWYKADTTFHSIPLTRADNSRLHTAVKDAQVVTQTLVHAFRNHESATEPRQVCREHGRILAALERGEADEARRAMAEHIRDSSFLILISLLVASCDNNMQKSSNIETNEKLIIFHAGSLTVPF
ncbi:MAG: FCD domain-containing protein, partial [Planctomycetota bacterium]|nr:FCD domain-containing protein [Planctomycetota bacterium]